MAGAAVVSAIGGVLGGLANAFSNQSRLPGASAGPPSARVDTSTAAIVAAADPKTRRAAVRNAREERLYALLTDPQVMGALVVVGGLLASSRIPFHEDPVTNARLQGIAGGACVLMGLGRAGVGDMTSLAFAGGAGLALGTSEGLGGQIPEQLQIPLLAGISPPGAVALALKQLVERQG